MHDFFYYPENWRAGLAGRHHNKWLSAGILAAAVDRIRRAICQ